MGDVRYLPHKVRLQHCDACDAAIQAQWNLALRSRYIAGAGEDEEMEPRVDHPFDIDLG